MEYEYEKQKSRGSMLKESLHNYLLLINSFILRRKASLRTTRLMKGNLHQTTD